MRAEESASPQLPNSLIVIISVILTVLVAFYLALSDALQTRMPPPVSSPPVAAITPQATIVSPPSTSTPVPPGQATETSAANITPTPTEISIIAAATCNNAPPDWIPIVAGPNDSVISLAVRYGATVGEIIRFNCLENGIVVTGMTIYVPQIPPTREPCGPPFGWVTYRVRPGETLRLLARRHGTTVYAIMWANCLTDTRIFAGRYLYLPPIPATIPAPPTIVFPTRTPKPSLTATATGLPSPTPSATTDGTASPTATGTIPTGTAVPTATATPTVTGTPPATNTPTPTVAATPVTTTPTPTGEASPTAVPTTTSTLPPTNTPAPTQPATNTPQPTQPPTNTPQPSATSPPEPSATP